MRATAALHRRRLVLRIRHGGRSQRNSYEPNWDLLREQHEAWNRRFRASSDRHGKVAAAPPERSQECHLGGGIPTTQTYKKNLLNEPDAAARATNTTDIGTRGKAANGQAGKGTGTFRIVSRDVV